MDIFAHTLWTGALYKGINTARKNKRPLRVVIAAFFGVLPDFFSFAPVIAWMAWQIVVNGTSPRSFPRPSSVEPLVNGAVPPIFEITHALYSLSHSAIVFFFVFALVTILRKKPFWELGGWLFHILVDVPTHTYRFYPTPVLWPLSEWKFNGIAWGEPWFMVINYVALLVVYYFLFRKYLKRTPKV